MPGYKENKGHDYVKNEFRKQCQVFAEKGVDFLLGEVRLPNLDMIMMILEFLSQMCLWQITPHK